MPDQFGDDAIVFDAPGTTAKVWIDKDGPYADVDNNYDKSFDSLADLVKWLNKNDYEYSGIDDRN